MNRRQFLKTAGICGLSLAVPPLIWTQKALSAPLPDNLIYETPARVPQVIHIFLYGGPSELAGNLTNIADIAANSQTSYPTSLNPENANHDITPNNFWGNAGGTIMEDLLANDDISIYRTIHRIKDNSRAHGRSIAQNLSGHLNASNAGIAATLAAILEKHNPFGKPVDELLLPFVSFEGNSRVFGMGSLEIPLALRPMALNANFKNPYARSKNGYLDGKDEDTNDKDIDALAMQVSAQFPHFNEVNEALAKRAQLADFIETNFNSDQIVADMPTDPDTGETLFYPETNFGARLRAAVSLAINNPESVFISLGSGGLGGWDDHSNALSRYPDRIRSLLEALQVAARHLALKDADHIVINVFGDFGRNVNLNKSNGWDHGNNQNLYTLGGGGIAGRSLGKLVGKTRRIGTPSKNRQFTSPTEDSYQCEPFAIASTLFSYFGVRNPELLNGEPIIDESDSVPNERV